MTDIKNVTLITGSSSGIGATLARLIAAPGQGLVLHARKAEGHLKAVAADCEAQGAAVVWMLGDLADAKVAPSLTDLAQKRFGRLDHLVANAGFPLIKSFADMTPEDVGYAFDANAKSLFLLAKAARESLIAAPAGRVVTVGSFTAHVFDPAQPQFPGSAASKAAVETATRSLSAELAPHGVTANCVVPGYIEKDSGTSDSLSLEKLRELEARIPLGRVGQQREVAETIRFLLSPAASYITGQSIHVNGGLC